MLITFMEVNCQLVLAHPFIIRFSEIPLEMLLLDPLAECRLHTTSGTEVHVVIIPSSSDDVTVN
jgi:hypothetical protein